MAIVDQNPPYWSKDLVSPMEIAFGFLGACSIKVFEYVKLREGEIKRQKEIEKRHEEMKCDFCGDSFTFVQDFSIHMLMEANKRYEFTWSDCPNNESHAEFQKSGFMRCSKCGFPKYSRGNMK